MLFGVFDGHGPKGEDASNFCRLNLPDIAGRLGCCVVGRDACFYAHFVYAPR